MRPKGLFRTIGIGIGVGIAHFVLQASTWASWDRALKPGEVRTIPWLWPIVSFPGFPLYDWLSGGDRTMFYTFNWVLLGNSLVWAITAALLLGRLARRRVEPSTGA